MEVLIFSAIFYLVLCFVISPVLFAKQATFIVLSFSFLSIYLLSELSFFVYVFCLITIISQLKSFFASLSECILFVLLCTGTTFWLTMQEFVDGFAYSYLFIATTIAIFSRLSYSSSNCRFFALLGYFLSSFINILLQNYTDTTMFFIGFILIFILTTNYSISLSRVDKHAFSIFNYNLIYSKQ